MNVYTATYYNRSDDRFSAHPCAGPINEAELEALNHADNVEMETGGLVYRIDLRLNLELCSELSYRDSDGTILSKSRCIHNVGTNLSTANGNHSQWKLS